MVLEAGGPQELSGRPPETKPLEGWGPRRQLGPETEPSPRAPGIGYAHRAQTEKREQGREVRVAPLQQPQQTTQSRAGLLWGRLRLGLRPFLAYFLLVCSLRCLLRGWATPACSPVSRPRAPPASAFLGSPLQGLGLPWGSREAEGVRTCTCRCSEAAEKPAGVQGWREQDPTWALKCPHRELFPPRMQPGWISDTTEG